MADPLHIYVFAPDRDSPTGGLKTLYRHVDILNNAGFSAFIVHGRQGFRCRWFENSTAVTWMSRIEPRPEDVVVIPEVYTRALQPAAPRAPLETLRKLLRRSEVDLDGMREIAARAGRVVILNLNAYLSFRGVGLDARAAEAPFTHPRIAAMLAISEDNERYLRQAFPGLRVVRFTKGVDPDRFVPAPEKQSRICLMPRKLEREAEQVLGLLRARGALEGFEVVPIRNKNEAEVAALLGEARVFLSFSHAEGLPRPPMEAMLCGCLVVGYHGRGGREYFDPSYSWPIEEGDVVGFARAAEQVLAALRRDPHAFDAQAERAREAILERYSPSREEADVTSFWRSLGS